MIVTFMVLAAPAVHGDWDGRCVFAVLALFLVEGVAMARRVTRRELAALAGAGVLAAPFLGRESRGATPEPQKGRVGVAPVAALPEGAALAPAAARKAVEAALAAATGAATAAAAAKALFKPGDTVGIKVNCIAGVNMSPRVELVEALVALVTGAGVPAGRIIIFERSSRELKRAGFAIRKEGGPYLCYGVDNDYDADPSTSGQIGSCFARLVSTTCTALISFGVVKDHDLAGVSAGMKNWYGVIHNPNKYHDHNCDPYVADVANHRFLRDKVRLTVLDGVVAQCHGGPGYRPDATFPLGLVAASTDPVAIDAWAWKVIDAERTRRGMPTLAAANRAPRFLATAAGYGLGVGDIAAIREVKA
jgi:uncharacterized protein (DUF362 family)